MYPDDPGFKARGTAEDAAESMKDAAPTLRLAAYTVLRTHGPRTSDEIAELLRVTPFAMRPRLTELKRYGVIKCVGQRLNASGRRANVYAALTAAEASAI